MKVREKARNNEANEDGDSGDENPSRQIETTGLHVRFSSFPHQCEHARNGVKYEDKVNRVLLQDEITTCPQRHYGRENDANCARKNNLLVEGKC